MMLKDVNKNNTSTAAYIEIVVFLQGEFKVREFITNYANFRRWPDRMIVPWRGIVSFHIHKEPFSISLSRSGIYFDCQKAEGSKMGSGSEVWGHEPHPREVWKLFACLMWILLFGRDCSFQTVLNNARWSRKNWDTRQDCLASIKAYFFI